MRAMRWGLCFVALGVSASGFAVSLTGPHLGVSAMAGAAASRPSGAIVLVGSVESTAPRHLVVRSAEHGRVQVFFATKVTLDGTPPPGSTVRVEGAVIDDFIRTATLEVMATHVTVEPSK